ncbi:MAG: lactoylglutathione lyase [Chloroflexi bacterium RBG_19FT_COMBO_55_16]|nr:MAG: lactoylglutathione lyase [Chloroflexi bacterium RBG_19FT_COMBO_55_16]
MSVTPLGTHTVTQIGIIVCNLEETVQAWSRLLGEPAPEIIVTESVGLTHAEYQGRPTPALAKLAFFQLGQVTLELIEPMGEPSTWQDQLVRHGQCLHHIAFEVKGMVERLEMLAQQGLPVLQRGDYRGGRYAYVDGQQTHGTIVELLEND